MSKGFDLPSNKHSGNSHEYWKSPQANSKQIVVQPLQWLPIDRDENGFATEECLDKIFNNLPVLLRHTQMDGGYDILNPKYERLKQWFRDNMKSNKTYTHYLPIPKLEV